MVTSAVSDGERRRSAYTVMGGVGISVQSGGKAAG